ncbi:MAG: 50S ribosomal protein L9, partial [Veillonella sp.]|nr:50S ribosomal protein L9 [Veillonella sp.]
MKVVLLEDVKKVGKKGEIVEVSDAYGRNVLIKKGLGLEGTATNVNNAKQKQESIAHNKAVANDEAKILAAQLTKVEVTVKVRMGEEGRVFGSVTAKDISDAAKAQYKVDIDKKKIEIKEPLKTLGVHDVVVRVHPEITSTIKVNSSGEAVDLVTSIVDRDDFYRDTHRIIYDAILNLVKSNKTVDFITLSEELERRKKLDTVGGIAYITSLANEATGYNIEEHARIIVEKAQMRRLIDAGNKIVGMTYAGEDEPSVIMNKAEQLVLDVGGQTQSESTFSPIGDVVLTNIDRLSKLQQHKSSITGVPTGFRDLDFKLNGLQRSDLILVAARPAMGKTAFTLNIAQNVAMGIKRTVAFFSLEMSKEQLVGRILSSVAGIESDKLRKAD